MCKPKVVSPSPFKKNASSSHFCPFAFRQCTTIVVYFVPKDDKVVAEPAAKRAKKASDGFGVSGRGNGTRALTLWRDEVGTSAFLFCICIVTARDHFDLVSWRIFGVVLVRALPFKIFSDSDVQISTDICHGFESRTFGTPISISVSVRIASIEGWFFLTYEELRSWRKVGFSKEKPSFHGLTILSNFLKYPSNSPGEESSPQKAFKVPQLLSQGSWKRSLAAYRCSLGKLARALRYRYGRSRRIWENDVS